MYNSIKNNKIIRNVFIKEVKWLYSEITKPGMIRHTYILPFYKTEAKELQVQAAWVA